MTHPPAQPPAAQPPASQRPLRPALPLLGILAGGLLLRALWLGWSSLEHLEVTYLFEAVKPASVLKVITSRQAAEQMHQPLYDLFLRLWASVSVDETWLRAPSVLFSLGCIPLIYRLARRELDTTAALIAAAFTAAAPLLVWYGRDATPYALFALLSLAAITTAQTALQTGSRRAAALTGLLLAAAFYTHFHGGWVAITVGLWMLLEVRTRPRAVWTTTAITALLCLPWIPALLTKLIVSVGGLTEDRPLMRYSHNLTEALAEAARMLLGGPTPAWALTLVLIIAGTWRLRRRAPRLFRLVLIAAALGVLAELHILWQLQRAKGILYVDIRHYLWLAPILLLPVAALPRRGPRLLLPAAVLVLQLATTIPLVVSTPKPDLRDAVAWVKHYATGPQHAVGFLPAPWYQPLIEYYLLGVCPRLVHGRSNEGWWLPQSCFQSETPIGGAIYGFPPTPERMLSATRRRSLQFLWVIEVRDHRFGLAVPPYAPQERFHCWRDKAKALIKRRDFGDWVTVYLFDTRVLHTVRPPPPETPDAPARTVTAAQAWDLHCPPPPPSRPK